MIMYTVNQEHMMEVIEEIAEIVSDSEISIYDMPIRALIYLLEQIENEALIKDFHRYVPVLLSSILSAFTNEDITSHGREQLLHIFYLSLRTISWADGIDNELVNECLNETFN